jgi:hypothetical protein
MSAMAGLIMLGVFVAIGLGIAFMLNSRWLGERGLVYNRYNPRPRRGGTLGLLESIYQPSIEHVIEERSSQKARGSRDESGEKPEAGRVEPPSE